MKLFRGLQNKDEELEAEIQHHLDEAIRERMARGETAEQARANARREFGNVGLVKEVTREMWGWASWERFTQDLRFGLRLLRKHSVFTLIAVLSLAFGIGANTAIFTIVDQLLVRALPVPTPEQLVKVLERGMLGDKIITNSSLSYPLYADYRDQNSVFAGLAGYSDLALSLSDGGQSERLSGLIVTGNYFEVLGVTSALGRTFLPEEDRTPGTHPVVVLSHGFWKRRFGGDPSIIGKNLALNGGSYTVIGVTPPEFTGIERGANPALFVPIMMQPQAMSRYGDALDKRTFSWLEIFGRLRSGVTPTQAQTEMTTLAAGFAEAYPENAFPEIVLEDSSKGEGALIETQLSTPLLLLMFTVALVLLIACANISNLLLARATARRKEIAVRLTVGASRLRLIRQLLTESLLLSFIGGLLGLLFAYWLSDALTAFQPPRLGTAIPVRMDWRVLGFSALLTISTGVIFGLAPALQATRTDLVAAMKDQNASLGQGKQRFTMRNLLVITQVALSLVVLVCAGLCLKSLYRLQAVDTGFEPSRIFVLGVDLGMGGYEKESGGQFYEQLSERISGLPGIEATTLGRVIPLSGRGMRISLGIEGYTPAPDEVLNFDLNVVGANYFTTLKMPLVSGRDFTAQDNYAAKKVVVINETAARTYWGEQNPVGRNIIFGSEARGDREAVEIVGVVKDSKYRTITERPAAMMFLPAAQNYFPDLALHVRTTTDAQAIIAAVRNIVKELDANLPVYNVRTLEQQKNDSLYAERMVATFLIAFGILGLLLAIMGIYGVMSYSVSQRTREIGIRMALGAQTEMVLRLVLRQGFGLVVVGLGIGLCATVAATRLLEGFLYGVSTTDLWTYLGVCGLLAGVALIACFLPARRAAKVDPMIALRYE